MKYQDVMRRQYERNEVLYSGRIRRVSKAGMAACLTPIKPSALKSPTGSHGAFLHSLSYNPALEAARGARSRHRGYQAGHGAYNEDYYSGSAYESTPYDGSKAYYSENEDYADDYYNADTYQNNYYGQNYNDYAYEDFGNCAEDQSRYQPEDCVTSYGSEGEAGLSGSAAGSLRTRRASSGVLYEGQEKRRETKTNDAKKRYIDIHDISNATPDLGDAERNISEKRNLRNTINEAPFAVNAKCEKTQIDTDEALNRESAERAKLLALLAAIEKEKAGAGKSALKKEILQRLRANAAKIDMGYNAGEEIKAGNEQKNSEAKNKIYLHLADQGSSKAKSEFNAVKRDALYDLFGNEDIKQILADKRKTHSANNRNLKTESAEGVGESVESSANSSEETVLNAEEENLKGKLDQAQAAKEAAIKAQQAQAAREAAVKARQAQAAREAAVKAQQAQKVQEKQAEAQMRSEADKMAVKAAQAKAAVQPGKGDHNAAALAKAREIAARKAQAAVADTVRNSQVGGEEPKKASAPSTVNQSRGAGALENTQESKQEKAKIAGTDAEQPDNLAKSRELKAIKQKPADEKTRPAAPEIADKGDLDKRLLKASGEKEKKEKISSNKANDQLKDPQAKAEAAAKAVAAEALPANMQFFNMTIEKAEIANAEIEKVNIRKQQIYAEKKAENKFAVKARNAASRQENLQKRLKARKNTAVSDVINEKPLAKEMRQSAKSVAAVPVEASKQLKKAFGNLSTYDNSAKSRSAATASELLFNESEALRANSKTASALPQALQKLLFGDADSGNELFYESEAPAFDTAFNLQRFTDAGKAFLDNIPLNIEIPAKAANDSEKVKGQAVIAAVQEAVKAADKSAENNSRKTVEKSFEVSAKAQNESGVALKKTPAVIEKAAVLSATKEAASEKAEASSKKAEAASEKAEASSKKAEAESKKAEAESEKAEASSEKAEASSEKAEAASKKTEAETEKAETSKSDAENKSDWTRAFFPVAGQLSNDNDVVMSLQASETGNKAASQSEQSSSSEKKPVATLAKEKVGTAAESKADKQADESKPVQQAAEPLVETVKQQVSENHKETEARQAEESKSAEQKTKEKADKPAAATGLKPESAGDENKGLQQNVEEAAQAAPIKEVSEKEKAEKGELSGQKAVKSEKAEKPVDDFEDKAAFKAYKAPPIELLKPDVQNLSEEEKEEIPRALSKRLEETLAAFSVNATVEGFVRGPTITRFEVVPGPGVKVSKIVNLADDIALSLAATAVRIEAPIPGKSAIGIEIPNEKKEIVGLRSIIEENDYQKQSRMTSALGRDIQGSPLFCDIASMPHLLIAGATGSGKSVCINSILISLLYHSGPRDLRLLMIDPKVVELSIYNGIPHLLQPVVTEAGKACGALQWAVSEMERRYDLFAENQVRDFKAYNRLNDEGKLEDGEHLPNILLVIDELSDLMQTTAKEVEEAIARLTAMARAAGIHLIIATQRPSVDVITGVIKSNIPSRIAFAVASQVDSRTILDMGGAEKLLGKGDMLYCPLDSPKPVRGQGAFVSDGEVEAVINYLQETYPENYYDPGVGKAIQANDVTAPGPAGLETEIDELLEDAARIVTESGRASVSYLQRKLGVGHPRAARMVDQLYELGIVGPYEGSKPRKVLVEAETVADGLDEIIQEAEAEYEA